MVVTYGSSVSRGNTAGRVVDVGQSSAACAPSGTLHKRYWGGAAMLRLPGIGSLTQVGEVVPNIRLYIGSEGRSNV